MKPDSYVPKPVLVVNMKAIGSFENLRVKKVVTFCSLSPINVLLYTRETLTLICMPS